MVIGSVIEGSPRKIFDWSLLISHFHLPHSGDSTPITSLQNARQMTNEKWKMINDQ